MCGAVMLISSAPPFRRRALYQAGRHHVANGIRLFLAVFIALLLGAVYAKHHNGQKAWHDRVAALFFSAVNNAFVCMVRAAPTHSFAPPRESCPGS
jgi:hypothetical protein